MKDADYLAVIMKEFISDCFKKTYKSYLNMLLYNQSCQIPPFNNSIAIFLNDMRQYRLSQDKRIHKAISF